MLLTDTKQLLPRVLKSPASTVTARQYHDVTPAALKQRLSARAVAPAPASLSRVALESEQVAFGKAFASFGEIVQGRLSNGDDFLVTLPVNLWSTCRLASRSINGSSSVKSDFEKSGRVAREMLDVLGMASGVSLFIDFDSSIPIGKGLSSSTADMLAVIRAFQDLYGIAVTKPFISRLFTQIEPHDGIHYDTSVAYNHRQGQLLNNFAYVPDFQIVGVDRGGELSTVEYNRKLSFTPQLLREYDALFHDLCAAFAQQDDHAIANCAQRSSVLHAGRTGNPLLQQLLAKVDSGKLHTPGILATHSGTCGGVLLPGNASEETLQQVEAEVAGLGHVFRTRTLRILL